ncbi:hypothetical protein M406DRAFT_64820 [Cryphonectria parasitica EP155]|uniref:Lipase 1 n=1 Tax=Cryphonectria parasitica (strain ATCC 38755 / EP155) TaxID=660469 RepID=A0A9P4XW34_CRYP1|nr:uncharacterized protein M406DRAFT_64820 [Cryphonectria parasitica EP155]KAF3761640.1 hypothetical protein M406DRAFT_64820 [Cryphonectria parasitica EP155]
MALLNLARTLALVSLPLPPSEDPWYTAPDGYEDAAPGEILRNRTAPGNLVSVVGSNCSAAYNLLYRTTASQGNVTFAVTTVLVPQSDVATNAVLSYQIPYDSAWIDASPSYALYESVPSDIKIALGKGYFVIVPDYEGPLASFTAGHMSGYATLDNVRAALNAADLYDLPDDPYYAVWGYSGGALASEWAAELQLDYAPELDFAGAALGGLTPNVTSVLLQINAKISAGLAPPAILGLLSQWPATQDYVFSQFTTNTKGIYTEANFMAAENYTLSDDESSYELQDIFLYFQNGEEVLTGAEVSAVVDQDGVMGLHGVPQMPVFAYKAIQDQISPIADTDALIAQYCAAGANILYERNTVGTHGSEALYGDPAATAWLDAVLTGTYAETYSTTGCTIENVTVQTSRSFDSDTRRARGSRLLFE